MAQVRCEISDWLEVGWFSYKLVLCLFGELPYTQATRFDAAIFSGLVSPQKFPQNSVKRFNLSNILGIVRSYPFGQKFMTAKEHGATTVTK